MISLKLLPWPRPLYSKPKLDRLPRGKAMTIAAGFNCAGGLVFCADRLISHGNADDPLAFGHYEGKLVALRGKDFSLVLCGAGYTTLIAEATQELKLRLADADFSHLHDDFAMSLKSSLKGILPEEQPPQLLIGIMSDSGLTYIFKTENKHVVSVIGKEIIGSGDNALTRYLVDFIYHPGLTLREGVALAVCTVWAGKRYCPR